MIQAPVLDRIAADSPEFPNGPRARTRVSLVAWLVIAITTLLMFTSAWDDSPSVDEPPHVTSGYLCLTAQNYQLNSWHPPLVKDIAAAPLLFMNLKSPLSDSRVQQDMHLAVPVFFYQSGHDAQAMIRAARGPMIILAALFLMFYFRRLRREYGEPTAFLAVLLLSVSPTFLAHSRFVTNDVAASAAFFACIAAFASFLKQPSMRSLCLVAAITGIAQLVKFSLILIYPVYVLLGIVWIALSHNISVRPAFHPVGAGFYPARDTAQSLIHRMAALVVQLAFIAVVGLGIVWAVYQAHTANLPTEFQHKYNVAAFDQKFGTAVPAVVAWTQDHPLFRGLSWYFTGLYAQGWHWFLGHPKPTYLLGQVYQGEGNPLYYPILFLTKEPVGFLLLLGGAVLLGVKALIQSATSNRPSVSTWCRHNFLAVSSLLFTLVYCLLAAGGSLNLGIRHLLPIYPFLCLLVSLMTVRTIEAAQGRKRTALLATLACLLASSVVSSLASWPGYLAYFNELAGGKERGASVAQGSNYDWGTDMLRLGIYLERNAIPDVYLIHSGPDNSYYYLGDRAHPLSLPERPPSGELIAVPVKSWQHILADWQGRRVRVKESGKWHELPRIYDPSQIKWFCTMKPIGKAGDSMLLFRAP